MGDADGHVLKSAAKALLAFAKRLLGLLPLADVADDAHEDSLVAHSGLGHG